MAHWRNTLELIERGSVCAVADVRFVGFGRGRVGSDFNDLLGAHGEAAVRQAVDAGRELAREHCELKLIRGNASATVSTTRPLATCTWRPNG